MSYRAVLFDAGETLVHPHPSFPELFAIVLKREGHEVEPAELRANLHLVAERFTRAAREGEIWSSSPERSRAFWGEIYLTLVQKLRLPDAESLADALYAEFVDLANYQAFPDVEGTLSTLQAAGL